jgi:hypothetical protein
MTECVAQIEAFHVVAAFGERAYGPITNRLMQLTSDSRQLGHIPRVGTHATVIFHLGSLGPRAFDNRH